MNIIQISVPSTRVVFAMVLCATFLLQSCGTTKIPFSTSPVVPAAEGNVKVKKDNNNNYSIDLSVIRLADPQRLSPSQNVYVVWMETEGKGTKNIGQIGTSSSFLSSALKSSLKTTTTFRPTGFFITAEQRADIVYPGSMLVLKTKPFSISK